MIDGPEKLLRMADEPPLRRVIVTRHAAADLFKARSHVVDGLPEDARCVGIYTNPEHDAIEFVVESDEFDAVDEAGPIPEYSITIEERRSMIPGPTETYLGYCVECGAKHEVGAELGAEERGCMCGGQIVPTETLARLAHRLWASWSTTLADEEPIGQERIDRWRQYWVPYEDLDEDVKQTDRDIVQECLAEPPDYPE